MLIKALARLSRLSHIQDNEKKHSKLKGNNNDKNLFYSKRRQNYFFPGRQWARGIVCYNVVYKHAEAIK